MLRSTAGAGLWVDPKKMQDGAEVKSEIGEQPASPHHVAGCLRRASQRRCGSRSVRQADVSHQGGRRFGVEREPGVGAPEASPFRRTDGGGTEDFRGRHIISASSSFLALQRCCMEARAEPKIPSGTAGMTFSFSGHTPGRRN